MKANNKKNSKFTIETVLSPFQDKHINHNIQNAHLWSKNVMKLKPEEVGNQNTTGWYSYLIKFDGLTPIHCMKIKKV